MEPPLFLILVSHKEHFPFDQKPTFKRKKLFKEHRAVPQEDVLLAPFTVTVTVMGP